MRSEGRLGHLSPCLHISDSHQIVLWYTQPLLVQQSIPREWKAQGSCSCQGPHEARGVFARGSCHPCKQHWAALVGKQPFLSHRLYLLFSPVQRSVTVCDSSAFCRFHGVIPDATPTTTLPSHMIQLWLLSAASRKAGKEAKYWSHYK